MTLWAGGVSSFSSLGWPAGWSWPDLYLGPRIPDDIFEWMV